MKTLYSVLSLIVLSTSSWAVDSLESVVAKHIEAKGGADNWAKIKTLKMTGTYTGFSIPDKFTLYKARANKYYFDYTLNSNKMTIGWDGKQAWWFDGWKELPVTTSLTGSDYQVMIQDAEMATPFFDYVQKGLKVTYKGEGEIDGTPALVLEVTRNKDHVETWYLNPDNYLEMARVSPGSNFGSPSTQTSFFDDFREVQGVMIPFFYESEFHTRHRVMEISDVEVNKAVDDALFSWPVHPKMAPLQVMAGTWNVKVEERGRPDQKWQESATTAVIKKQIRGHLLQETIVIGEGDDGIEHIRQWTYDPFEEIYRITQMNDFTTHLNLMEGQMEEGLLKTDNVASKTPWKAYGRTFHEGLQWRREGNGFVVEMVRSFDAGNRWFVNKRFTYQKK